MTHNPGCSRCNDDKEDVLHMIRDCMVTREIWEIALLTSPQSDFFSPTSIQDWILKCMFTGPSRRGELGWQEKMAIIIWCLWRWRNVEVFEKERLSLHTRWELISRCVEETRLAWGVDHVASNSSVPLEFLGQSNAETLG